MKTINSDRDIIVSSAKALELRGYRFIWIEGMPYIKTHPSISDAFNPLKNDKDAFSLLCALKIGLPIPIEGVRAACLSDVDCYHSGEEKYGGPNAATRRAVAIAAAAIWEHHNLEAHEGVTR